MDPDWDYIASVFTDLDSFHSCFPSSQEAIIYPEIGGAVASSQIFCSSCFCKLCLLCFRPSPSNELGYCSVCKPSSLKLQLEEGGGRSYSWVKFLAVEKLQLGQEVVRLSC